MDGLDNKIDFIKAFGMTEEEVMQILTKNIAEKFSEPDSLSKMAKQDPKPNTTWFLPTITEIVKK